MSNVLPNDVVLGVATSAHQVEGGDMHTDWWDFERSPGSVIKDQHVSGRAVDFWTRFSDDIACMREHGIESHRMSVSWGRIEPEEGRFDESALDHYAEIVNAHRDAGIRVAVTLLHFALPRWLAARGGLLAHDAADRFYAFSGALGLIHSRACSRSTAPAPWWIYGGAIVIQLRTSGPSDPKIIK